MSIVDIDEDELREQGYELVPVSVYQKLRKVGDDEMVVSREFYDNYFSILAMLQVNVLDMQRCINNSKKALEEVGHGI